MAVKNILVAGSAFLLGINDTLNTFLFFVVGALYLGGFRHVYQRVKRLSIATLIGSAIVICISALVFNENIPHIAALLPRTITYCFVGLLYISSIDDFKYFLDYMTRFSYIIILAAAIGSYMLFQNARAGYLDSLYSMPMSYSTSIGVVFLLYKYIRDRAKTDLIMAAAGVFVIMAFGSRQHLMPALSYIALAYIRSIRTPVKAIVRGLLPIALGFLIVPNLGWMANQLNDVLAGMGMHSRTLALLASGRIMDLSGRGAIYDTMLSEFHKRPLMGIGIEGARVVAGTTPHNMYLEIFVTLGVVIGSVVSMFMVYIILNGIWSSRRNVARELILIYLCLVIPRGFVGGGLWDFSELWSLLGVCISVIANASSGKRYRPMAHTTL